MTSKPDRLSMYNDCIPLCLLCVRCVHVFRTGSAGEAAGGPAGGGRQPHPRDPPEPAQQGGICEPRIHRGTQPSSAFLFVCSLYLLYLFSLFSLSHTRTHIHTHTFSLSPSLFLSLLSLFSVPTLALLKPPRGVCRGFFGLLWGGMHPHPHTRCNGSDDLQERRATDRQARHKVLLVCQCSADGIEGIF